MLTCIQRASDSTGRTSIATGGLYSVLLSAMKLLKNLDKDHSSSTAFPTIKRCIVLGSLRHHIGMLRGLCWVEASVVTPVEGTHR